MRIWGLSSCFLLGLFSDLEKCKCLGLVLCVKVGGLARVYYEICGMSLQVPFWWTIGFIRRRDIGCSWVCGRTLIHVKVCPCVKSLSASSHDEICSRFQTKWERSLVYRSSRYIWTPPNRAKMNARNCEWFCLREFDQQKASQLTGIGYISLTTCMALPSLTLVGFHVPLQIILSELLAASSAWRKFPSIVYVVLVTLKVFV